MTLMLYTEQLIIVHSKNLKNLFTPENNYFGKLNILEREGESVEWVLVWEWNCIE